VKKHKMFGLLALSLSACGVTSPTEVTASSSVEAMLLSETTRYSALLGKHIEGVITEERYFTPQGEALAWYINSTAYYNRALTEQLVSIAPEGGKELATNVAAHEVAHSIEWGHNCIHVNVVRKLGAQSTYPVPEGC
jgi:hypothetical protein